MKKIIDTRLQAPLTAPSTKNNSEIADDLQSSAIILPVDKKNHDPLGRENITALQLPSDFPKTPSTRYQAGYAPFEHSNGLATGEEAHLGYANNKVPILAALTALLYRYTQQNILPITVNVVHASLNGIQLDATASVCSSIVVDQPMTVLAQQIEASLQSLETSGQPSIPQNSSGETLFGQSQGNVAVTFLPSNLQFQTVDQWIIWLKGQNFEGNSDSDLHLILFPLEQDISGTWLYNTNLFLPETIQRLSGHFQTALRAIQQQPMCSIARLPLLTANEQQQLLVGWKSAVVDYPQKLIYRLIETQVERSPDAIAVTFQGQSLTYALLNQRANQLAYYLKHLGVEAGDRVALCIQPSLDIATALFGIFKAGGVYVPLDPTHPVERLAVILDDIQAKVLLLQTALVATLPTTSSPVVYLDQDWPTIDAFPTHNLDHSVDLDQTAYIIYTSGTTGKPKGVMASHRNLVNYILATQDRFGFNTQDVIPAIARFTFSISLFELLSPLTAGGTLVILERDHILDFPRLIQTLEQLTMLHTVPSLMQRLVNYIKENRLDVQKFKGINHIFTGGDIVPPDLLETLKEVFPSANVNVLYGCSEVSSLCASYPVLRGKNLTRTLVGKPFNNVEIRLYDPHQNLAPIGVSGEIYVGGAGVTQGYLHQEGLTREKFITIDGQLFYKTGDMGRFGDDGNLEFLGRADFQVKLRGIRIELGEIESVLRRSPGVKDGVVAAQDLGSGEHSLVAYVVFDQTRLLEQTQATIIVEVRQLLAKQLPDYMVPAAFVVLEAMPLNANQKVDRRALPQSVPETLLDPGTITLPRNALEQNLVEIWEAVLGIQPIGVQNSFLEIGGNSLLAVQMLTQIEDRLGKVLPITSLLQSPTIEALAILLSQDQQEEEAVELVPLRSSGSKLPLFCIYGLLVYQELVDHLSADRPVYGVYLQEEIDLIKKGLESLNDSTFTTVPNIAARYVQAIRKLQPQGPYYLAGMSFGGVVAFEMGQQLRAAGQEVALIAMMDSVAPNYYANISFLKRLQLHGKLLIEQGPFYFLGKTKKRLKSLIMENPILGALDRRAEFRGQASQSYVPAPYPGKLVLFRAMEGDSFGEVIGSGARDIGWKSFATGDFSIFDVPGDHLGILKTPNVQVMAKKLQACLDEAA